MLSRTYSLRISVAIGVCVLMVGCASLYQPLPKRIVATHLSCDAYPKLVDGDLATNSLLRVSIYANRDLAGATRDPLTGKTKVSFEDVVIREIQVYQ